MGKVRVVEGQMEWPPDAISWLEGTDELALFILGDTLVLKKVQVPLPATIAERAPDPGMPLEDVVAEVHAYRQEKRRASGR